MTKIYSNINPAMLSNFPTPLISILMLTYNRAPYIGEAIASVLTQTYPNWELIILDDGSTDNTADVVASFTDRRIRYIKNMTNQGLIIRRKESLTYASGEYIAILDSDDLWLDPTKLIKQVAYLEANPQCAVVGTFVTIIDSFGEKIGHREYPTEDTSIRNRLLCSNQFTHSSVLMQSILLQRVAGYRFPIAEDFDLFLQLGQYGTFANLPEPMTGYRVHQSNETSRRRAMFEYTLKILEIHRDNYPNYYFGFIKYSFYNLVFRYI